MAAEPSVVFTDIGRSFGITVGDKLAHHYVIKCDVDESLIESSLPRAGELSYWLSLVSVDAEHIGDEDHCLYSLKFIYQTFYAPLDVRALDIPAIHLQFQDLQQHKTTLAIPDWTFTMSPIKRIEPGGVGGEQSATSFMQGSIRPSRLSTIKYRQLQLMSFCVLVISVLIVSRLSGWISLGYDSPFLHAKKRIKQQLSTQDDEQANLKKCLIFIHEAFNLRAGYTLFTSNLNDFFEQQPHFVLLREEVEAFYRQSQASFFFDEPLTEEAINKALQLCERLAMSDKVKLRR